MEGVYFCIVDESRLRYAFMPLFSTQSLNALSALYTMYIACENCGESNCARKMQMQLCPRLLHACFSVHCYKYIHVYWHGIVHFS